jgi:hypothetical protein
MMSWKSALTRRMTMSGAVPMTISSPSIPMVALPILG